MGLLYFEDFSVGQVFHGASTYTMEKEAIIAFAREFDPQPQHIDEEAAKDTQFGQLVASGWHTAGASMRLKVLSPMAQVHGALAGLGVESMRWPRPTLPGDVIRIVITILETRVSQSKPDKGILRYRIETFNQRDELVMEVITAVIIPRRPA